MHHLLKVENRCSAQISTMTHTSSWSELRHPTTYAFHLFQKPGLDGQVTNTSHCFLKKLLLNLESGDAVKAERGFMISIELKLEQKGIEKDRAQLTGQEVYKSRRVAEARQAIGKIKTFVFSPLSCHFI